MSVYCGLFGNVPARNAEVQSLPRPARNASARGSPDGNGESDARWLWVAVIGLLMIELPLRRRAQGAVASAVEERARAA